MTSSRIKQITYEILGLGQKPPNNDEK